MLNQQSMQASWTVDSRILIDAGQLRLTMIDMGCRVQNSVAHKLYGVVTLAQPVELSHGLELNRVELGAFSYISENSVVWHARIGNYVSIARDVLMGMAGHPTDWVSPSPVGYMNFFNEYAPEFVPQSRFAFFPKLTQVDHSAWIGARVIIPGNKPIKIGRGAIVAAGSIVTKDVPAYSIVAGNPARVLRMRFDDSTVEMLESTGWWDYDVVKLHSQGVKLDFSNVIGFVESFSNLDDSVRAGCKLSSGRLHLSRVGSQVQIQQISPTHTL